MRLDRGGALALQTSWGSPLFLGGRLRAQAVARAARDGPLVELPGRRAGGVEIWYGPDISAGLQRPHEAAGLGGEDRADIRLGLEFFSPLPRRAGPGPRR